MDATDAISKLLDSLVQYIDDIGKRQDFLKREIELNYKNISNIDFILKRQEIEILYKHSSQISNILKQAMTDIMESEISCECETGKAVQKHSPNCKWMHEIFGNDKKIIN